MQCVYCISCEDVFKIGIAENVGKRLSELQIGNPRPLMVVSSFSLTNQMAWLTEQVFHRAFCSKRIRGEWFSLNELDISMFNKTCKQLQENDDNFFRRLCNKIYPHGVPSLPPRLTDLETE